MFHSDNPVWDYERYCNYCDKKNKEWHEENDYIIEEKIEDLDFFMENLKLCKNNEEVEELFKKHNREIFFELDDDVENTINNELEILQHELEDLEEELER